MLRIMPTAIALAASLCQAAIVDISPERGGPFFSVTLRGEGFRNAGAVTFNGINAICFWVNPAGDTVIALAPESVTTGPVKVVTSQQTHTSPTSFQVVAGADPTRDFGQRDSLPQTRTSRDRWCTSAWNAGWGPWPAQYPLVPSIPDGVDPAAWKRARFIAAALHFRGLPYQHHHIPAFDARECTTQDSTLRVGPGLDCSNFTAWVLNYGFGLTMSSGITVQADAADAGTLLTGQSPLMPGDLLFIRGNPTSTTITHVAMYVDPGHRIDSHDTGVEIRTWGRAGYWPFNSFSHARRPLDRIVSTPTMQVPSTRAAGAINHGLRTTVGTTGVRIQGTGAQAQRRFDTRGRAARPSPALVD